MTDEVSQKLPYQVGHKPYTVTIYERTEGGNLYVRTWDPDLRGAGEGGMIRRSLGHRDFDAAVDYAQDQFRKIRDGSRSTLQRNLTLEGLFRAYERAKTSHKSERMADEERRRMRMFVRFFGAETDPLELSNRNWDAFVRALANGRIDHTGERVADEDRRTYTDEDGEQQHGVRQSTVRADLLFLCSVYKWGHNTEDRNGDILLPKNPLRTSGKFELPKAQEPRRKAASRERYEATLAVAADVHAFLPTLLVLANETGRRIGAIRQLQYRDLKLDQGEHGKVRWRKATDKKNRGQTVPISQAARRALGSHMSRNPGIGRAWLFPAAQKEGEPVGRQTVYQWLERAEERAGLETLTGKTWHAYRAKFATDMLNTGTPPGHVAKLGGWKDGSVVLRIYDQPDDEALTQSLEERWAASSQAG